MPLLGGQQLLEILRFLDEAVEAAGQVDALAPGDVHVLVLGEGVANVRLLGGDVLDKVAGTVWAIEFVRERDPCRAYYDCAD